MLEVTLVTKEVDVYSLLRSRALVVQLLSSENSERISQPEVLVNGRSYSFVRRSQDVQAIENELSAFDTFASLEQFG